MIPTPKPFHGLITKPPHLFSWENRMIRMRRNKFVNFVLWNVWEHLIYDHNASKRVVSLCWVVEKIIPLKRGRAKASFGGNGLFFQNFLLRKKFSLIPWEFEKLKSWKKCSFGNLFRIWEDCILKLILEMVRIASSYKHINTLSDHHLSNVWLFTTPSRLGLDI